MNYKSCSRERKIFKYTTRVLVFSRFFFFLQNFLQRFMVGQMIALELLCSEMLIKIVIVNE